MKINAALPFVMLIFHNLFAADSASYFISVATCDEAELSLISSSYKNIGLVIQIDTVDIKDTMICNTSGCNMITLFELDTNTFVSYEKINLLEGCATYSLFNSSNEACTVNEIQLKKGGLLQITSDSLWGDVSVTPGYDYKIYYRAYSAYNNYRSMCISGIKADGTGAIFNKCQSWGLNSEGLSFPEYPDSTNIDSLKSLLQGTWNWITSHNRYFQTGDNSREPTDTGMEARTLQFTTDSVFYSLDSKLVYSSLFHLADSGRSGGPKILLPGDVSGIDKDLKDTIPQARNLSLIGTVLQLNSYAYYLKADSQLPLSVEYNESTSSHYLPKGITRICRSNRIIQIQSTLPTSGRVTADIMDCMGRMVCKAIDDYVGKGDHNFEVNLANFAKGIYWLQFNAPNIRMVRRILLVQ